MIEKAIRLHNNLVMVFDENGEQLAEYQGHYNDVKWHIITSASSLTQFFHWPDKAAGPRSVPPEHW
jgi:hypothetical protein